MISYCIKKVRQKMAHLFYAIFLASTYQGRGCLEKRIFPLLNVEASWVGLVGIRGVGAWKNGFFPY